MRAAFAAFGAFALALVGCGRAPVPSVATEKAASVYETDGVRVEPEGITCRERGEPVAEFPVDEYEPSL